MSSYRRPEIEPVVFRDADGVVIEYGNRWGGESPPEDSYSVLSNVERFRPLHAVADALVDALVDDYDVRVEDDASVASDLMHTRDDVERAVRLTPADPAAAALTFVFTSLPSVLVHAGLLNDFLYPVCLCDACDEDWERIAEAMEGEITAIVEGGYSETADDEGISFRLVGASGSRSGWGRSSGPPSARLTDAVSRLAALEGWAAWSPHRDEPHRGEEHSG